MFQETIFIGDLSVNVAFQPRPLMITPGAVGAALRRTVATSGRRKVEQPPTVRDLAGVQDQTGRWARRGRPEFRKPIQSAPVAFGAVARETERVIPVGA